MHESIPSQPEQHNKSFQEEINESRRKFLKDAAITAALAPIALTVPKGFEIGRKMYGETIDRENVESELNTLREQLRNERGVEIDFGKVFSVEKEVDFGDVLSIEKEPGIEGESLDFLVEKRAVCQMLLEEFALYPSFTHKNTGLSIIRVVNNLKYDNEVGTAGLADSAEGVMHLEYEEKGWEIKTADEQVAHVVSALIPQEGTNIERMRSTFHHEMEHFIDRVDANEWSKETRGYVFGEGLTLEQAAYLYDNELSVYQKNGTIGEEEMVKYSLGIKGFARRYGRRNHAEDRATIAETLYAPQDRDAFTKRLEKDDVLAAKVEKIKEIYFKQSRGLMDRTYWNLVQKEEDNQIIISKYLNMRAQMLIKLSGDAFMQYIQNETGDEVDVDDAQEWRESLSEWVETNTK
jgi:hypothetical protein